MAFGSRRMRIGQVVGSSHEQGLQRCFAGVERGRGATPRVQSQVMDGQPVAPWLREFARLGSSSRAAVAPPRTIRLDAARSRSDPRLFLQEARAARQDIEEAERSLKLLVPAAPQPSNVGLMHTGLMPMVPASSFQICAGLSWNLQNKTEHLAATQIEVAHCNINWRCSRRTLRWNVGRWPCSAANVRCSCN